MLLLIKNLGVNEISDRFIINVIIGTDTPGQTFLLNSEVLAKTIHRLMKISSMTLCIFYSWRECIITTSCYI